MAISAGVCHNARNRDGGSSYPPNLPDGHQLDSPAGRRAGCPTWESNMSSRRWSVWAVISLIITIIGLGGLPDDLRGWGKFFEIVVPMINHDVGRWLFVIVGLSVLAVATLRRFRHMESAAIQSSAAQPVPQPTAAQVIAPAQVINHPPAAPPSVAPPTVPALDPEKIGTSA